MTDERWMYQADAVPCAANITRPFRDSWVLSAALPVVGGRSEIQHNATAFRNIFAIESAYALLTGEETPDDQVETNARTEIQGFTMANELTADLVSLSARGVYRPSWRFRDERRRMAHIYPLERIIRGLRIRGQLQSITLERSPASFPESGAIDPTLKKLAESNDERVIVVSNFGKVFYDQWTISDGSVNGTMLRIELGSPVAGAVVVGSVRVNGNWYP